MDSLQVRFIKKTSTVNCDKPDHKPCSWLKCLCTKESKQTIQLTSIIMASLIELNCAAGRPSKLSTIPPGRKWWRAMCFKWRLWLHAKVRTFEQMLSASWWHKCRQLRLIMTTTTTATMATDNHQKNQWGIQPSSTLTVTTAVVSLFSYQLPLRLRFS